MRNMIIIRIIAWSVVALILLMMLIAGINNSLPFNIISLGKDIHYGSSGMHYDNSDKYTAGESSMPAEDISALDINWNSGDILIEEYEGNDIVFSESADKDLEEEDKLHYYLNGDGKLTIQFCASKSIVGKIDDEEKDLTVKVPKDHPLIKLDIQTVSGSARIEGVSATKINVDSTSADITILNIISEEIDIENVSGKINALDVTAQEITAGAVSGSIEIAGDISKLDCETVSGGIALSPGAGVTEINAQSVSQDIEIKLPEDIDGFTAEVSSVSGDTTSDFGTSFKNDNLIYGNGRAQFELENTSGDISIVN